MSVTFAGVHLHLGGRQVLEDVDYEFTAGNRYVIRGESGAGKTSILNLAAGYLAPTRGEVLLDSRAEYLFQDELLFSSLTAQENLRLRPSVAQLSASEQGVRIGEVLGLTGLSECADVLVSFMSGGERRRLQAAGMLFAQPAVVLLDEPTANLDHANRVHFAEVISELFASSTIIATAHDDFATNLRGAIALRLKEGQLVEEF